MTPSAPPGTRRTRRRDAGRRRDRAALAESLELRALAGPSRRRDVERLAEAETIWRELGNPAGQARAALVGALLAGDDEAARRAEAALAEVGAKGYRAALALVHPLTGVPPVVVQSLGRFRVLLSGEPVPLGGVAVAQGARPAQDPRRAARPPDPARRPDGGALARAEARPARQSPVGPLSTVRAVLDPGKRHDQDHFVGADKNAVWLDRANLVDRRRGVPRGRPTRRSRSAPGRRARRAVARLTAAEAAYAGDFLEEDAYEDWAVAVREEARAAYIGVARALADDAAARGDVDATTRYSLRVLERDPYDEPAHLGLVGGARPRGPARRGATLFPHLLRTHGRDRRRVGSRSRPHRVEASRRR